MYQFSENQKKDEEKQKDNQKQDEKKDEEIKSKQEKNDQNINTHIHKLGRKLQNRINNIWENTNTMKKQYFTKNEKQQTKENSENVNIENSKNNEKEINKDEQKNETTSDQNQPFQKFNEGYKLLKSAWQKTFPDEKYLALQKQQKLKEQAKKQKELEEKAKQYTEEELQELQDKIPEWKKNQLQVGEPGKAEKQTLRSKLKLKIKHKLNSTETAKQIYQSEKYKEYEDFQKEMKQFKEDSKDYLNNSPSNLVQGSLYVMNRVKNESEHARAIRKMREFDPDFDIWNLESEAQTVFENTFCYFLCDEVKMLEKVCGEQALGYFKVLIKKRQTDKSEHKYKQLWTAERAQFSKAFIPDGNLPIFVFNIKVQEIHCLVSIADRNKIVDGSDDRIMSNDYMFSLRYHTDPDVEELGHRWEIVELQPRAIVQLLV